MKKAPLVVQNLLLLLPMVRQADLDIKNFFKSVQQNQQGNVKLNKLLVEMLEHAWGSWWILKNLQKNKLKSQKKSRAVV